MSNNLYAPPAPTMPGEQLPIQRFTMWGLSLVTLCITVAFIRSLKVTIGIDPFSLTFWGFVPVVAMVAALAATSGYMLAATRMKWQADTWDLVFLMATCLLLHVLLVALDYWAVLLAQPQGAAHLGFGQFFADSVTKVEYMVQSRQYGTSRPQAVGESGWVLLLPRLGGLMAAAKVIHSSFGRAKAYPAF